MCSLLLVQDAQCINFLAVLPANRLDFVNGMSASRLRNIVCLNFEIDFCSKGINSLTSQNSKRGPFVVFLKSGQTLKSLLIPHQTKRNYFQLDPNFGRTSTTVEVIVQYAQSYITLI